MFVCQSVKEGFVLSRAIFDNAIRVFTRHIPSYLIESYIDDSHFSYASNIFLLYNNVDTHQNVVDVFCSKLRIVNLIRESLVGCIAHVCITRVAF